MKRDGLDEILEQVNNVCISNSFEVPLRHTFLLLTISECVYGLISSFVLYFDNKQNDYYVVIQFGC